MDRRDSWIIADLVRIGRGRAALGPDPTMLQLRQLSHFRLSRIAQGADLRRKMLSLLDRAFPHDETHFSTVFRKSSRALLEQAATADDVAAFDRVERTAVLGRTSRGRVGEEKARPRPLLAAQSLGASCLTEAGRVAIRCLLAPVTFWEEQGAEREERIAALRAPGPTAAYRTTIKGMGPTVAATILAEIDPSLHQSGQFPSEHATLAKRGSPYLRRAIWVAAHSARQHHPDLQAVYARGVAHRLLNRISGIVKEQRPFVVHVVGRNGKDEAFVIDNASQVFTKRRGDR